MCWVYYTEPHSNPHVRSTAGSEATFIAPYPIVSVSELCLYLSSVVIEMSYSTFTAWFWAFLYSGKYHFYQNTVGKRGEKPSWWKMLRITVV